MDVGFYIFCLVQCHVENNDNVYVVHNLVYICVHENSFNSSQKEYKNSNIKPFEKRYEKYFKIFVTNLLLQNKKTRQYIGLSDK